MLEKLRNVVNGRKNQDMKELWVRPVDYSVMQLNARQKDILKEKLREATYIGEKDAGVRRRDYDYEILKRRPSEGYVNKNTEIHLVDFLYYDEEKDALNIPEDRLIVVKEIEDKEEYIEVSDIDNFVKILNKTNKAVFKSKNKDKWQCAGYILNLEDKKD